MSNVNDNVTESAPVRFLLIFVGLAFMFMIVGLPILTVFIEALRKGLEAYWAGINEEYAIAAIKLTLLVTAIAVPFNVIFGLAASWAIAKFEFVGKRLLLTFIDLPFSVSPVISGLIYVLL